MLVQYRLSKVFAPVGAMQQSLLREGAVALFSILFVSATLWLFVRRVGDERADRSRKLAAAIGEGREGVSTEQPDHDTSERLPRSDMTETMEPPGSSEDQS